MSLKIQSTVYLASNEDKRGREEKNARFILRITAAAFSLALPSTWESMGWEEAQDNLMKQIRSIITRRITFNHTHTCPAH